MAAFNPVARASFSTATFPNPLPLLADGHDVTSRNGTVASGTGVLKRGTICKIVPASGVITIGATAAEANCVLAEDVDATSATVGAIVYLTGRMKADAITWPGALNHADVTDALRSVGIYIESVVAFSGTTVKSLPKTAEAAEAVRLLEKARELDKKAQEAKEEPPADQAKPADSVLGYVKPGEDGPHLEDLALQVQAAEQEEKKEKGGEAESKPHNPAPHKEPERKK